MGNQIKEAKAIHNRISSDDGSQRWNLSEYEQPRKDSANYIWCLKEDVDWRLYKIAIQEDFIWTKVKIT